MNRVRDNSTVRLYAASETVYEADGSISYGPTSETFPATQADVMTDVVTPGFRRASASGEIHIKPMTRVKCKRELGGSDILIRVVGGPSAVTRGFPPLVGLDVNPWAEEKVREAVAELEGEAVTESFARVGSPDVAVLTELAELKETLAFLSSPVRAMVKLTRRFRRHLDVVSRMELVYQRRLAKWQSLPARVRARREQPKPPKLPTFKVGKWEGKDIPSAWLAYRYGIMPLIYTFQDVEALIKKRVEGTAIRATARSKKGGSVDLSETYGTHHLEWRGTTYQYDQVKSGGCSVTVRAGVLYNVDASLMTQLGVQWNRVPMALYEAIPLSFVSDWFHNGAEVYDALTAEFRSKGILGSWVTTRIDFDVQYTDYVSPYAPNCIVSGHRNMNVVGTTWERKLTSGSDVKFSFRNDLNLKRVADGLALCYTLLATARKK